MSKLDPASRAVRIAHVRMVIERCVVDLWRKTYFLEQIINSPVVLCDVTLLSYDKILLISANLQLSKFAHISEG